MSVFLFIEAHVHSSRVHKGLVSLKHHFDQKNGFNDVACLSRQGANSLSRVFFLEISSSTGPTVFPGSVIPLLDYLCSWCDLYNGFFWACCSQHCFFIASLFFIVKNGSFSYKSDYFERYLYPHVI